MLNMRSLICFALLLVSSVSFVSGAPRYRRDIQRRRGCGTHISAERRTSSERRFQTNRLPPGTENATATLDVYFHVVFANKTLEGGYVPDETIHQQLETMNRDYNSTHISWNLVNITRIESPEWFARVAPDSPEESELKKVFRYGNASSLNVWSVGLLEGDGKGLLGYATFPSDYESKPQMDGVVLLHSSMPGGLKPPYNEGRTLVHESGHWAGLYHTFEGGCTGSGDFVDDTPPEREASYGCQDQRSSCPGGKQDPITNFMDYADDTCMTGFTEGQGVRIRAQLRTFRSVEI